jgi:exodeoxyribonuclease V alpha subunit
MFAGSLGSKQENGNNSWCRMSKQMELQMDRPEKPASDWWADGLETGWLGLYEMEMIRFLGKEFGKLSQDEKLCAVFTSLFLKSGHTCLPLEMSPQEWGGILGLEESSIKILPSVINVTEIKKSSLTGDPGDKNPFLLENNQLMFNRIRNSEQQIAEWIRQKSSYHSMEFSSKEASNEMYRLFGEGDGNINWQKTAAALSLIKPFVIISGGPGTGKTTTVARILALHQRLAGRPLKIALAAPTGKAAGRMAEALTNVFDSLDLSGEEKSLLPKEAKTLHRLLSGLEHRGLLPPVEKKLLHYDLVIVDEASMIDLTLVHRLISHLSEKTRLILIGDKDQLASVEAGSVFADLCSKPDNSFQSETADMLTGIGADGNLPVSGQSVLNDSIVYLTKSYRFGSDSGIGSLAGEIKSGASDQAGISEIISKFEELSHMEFTFEKEDFDRLINGLSEKLKETAALNNPAELIAHWKRSVWLGVLRRGLTGTDRLNRLAEQQIAALRIVPFEKEWYHGRPVIITQNDYNLDVFNGDLGVCMRDSDEQLWVYVETGSEIKRIKPHRLIHYEPAYFLTVHKSQGSEFSHVNLLLPRSDTPVLTRELIYTAVTRAKNSFSLFGEMNLFVKGIKRKTERYTGLKERLRS